MRNEMRLQNESNPNSINKKITYILFVSQELLSSTASRHALKLTIFSVINQTVPLCDLIIVSPKQVIARLSKLIYECVSQTNVGCGGGSHLPQVINYPFRTDDSDFLSTINPEIRLYESANEKYGSTLNTLKNEIRTEWIALINHKTELATHATYELIIMMLENPDSAMIYADHDHINDAGLRLKPVFKPSFSLDLLYSQNYIGSFFAIKSKYIKNRNLTEINYCFLNFTYSIILDLIQSLILNPVSNKSLSDNKKNKIKSVTLRNLVNKIIHIPNVLHSQRKSRDSISAKKEQYTQHLGLLNAHLQYCYSDVVVSEIKPAVYRHQWPVSKIEPLVSIIIPTKDSLDILSVCISSIINKTTYNNYEIIIVDNQSTDLKTHNYLKKLSAKYNNIRVIKYSKKFNYSDINNIAVKYASGIILCFLNNDVEVITPDWLTEMVSHALRPDVGCVGAMHYYPDCLIQHAGVIVGMHGVAGHAFKGHKKLSRYDSNNYLYSIRNPDAVTAATLVVRRELFELVGGFDSEYLKVAFNDVDLCLKISNQGYRCLWTPYAEFFHYESKTRNLEIDDISRETELFEHKIMQDRWLTHCYPVRDLLRSIKLN